MLNARFFFALVVLAGAALAACSGNLGAGTSAPGGLLPSGPLSGVGATSSPTPSSANNIVTYGDSVQFQPLPQVGGYGGAIAFEAPNPRPSGFQAIPVGATLSVVAPQDTPDLNLASGTGKKATTRARRARALVYISLLATHDITLATYPRLAIDVPRDIVTTYRVEEIELALYNAGAKDKTFKLAVADHDTASPPPPPVPGQTAPPPPSAIPVSATSASPGAVPSGFPSGTLTPAPTLPGGAAPPAAVPSVSPTLPPQRILFAASPVTLKLIANSPVVFAVYALPIATPSPAPSGSGSGAPKSAVSASASASASASGSPAAAATASAEATASSSGTASPAASPT